MKTRRDVVKWLGSLPGTIMMANQVDAAGRKLTALLLDPLYKEHDPGPGHPEQPARYDAVTRAIEDTGLLSQLHRVDVRVANDALIARLQTQRLRLRSALGGEVLDGHRVDHEPAALVDADE